MGPRKKPKDIEAELRQAIEKDGRTVYRLAADSGVSAGQIGRFVTGERTLTLAVAAKLATALGLQLAPAVPAPAALEAPAVPTDLDGAVLAVVRAKTDRSGSAKLANVFKALQTKDQALTLGTFHDAVRRLHAAGKVRLTPWTQAMYQLDSPEACLLCGREIMAYAEVR